MKFTVEERAIRRAESKKKSIENRQSRTILILVENGKIEKESIVAAKLLFDSCFSRINDCNKNSGYYHDNNIQCDWDSIEGFFIDCFDIQGFWEAWKRQYLIFKATGKKSSRPTIDRIDEKRNYSKDNIGVLSHRENVLKAKRKPCKAILFREGNIIGSFIFDSRNQFTEEFNKRYAGNVVNTIKFDTAKIQKLDVKTSILLQYDSIDIEKAGDNEANYDLILTNCETRYYDTKTLELIKVEKFDPVKAKLSKLFIK